MSVFESFFDWFADGAGLGTPGEGDTPPPADPAAAGYVPANNLVAGVELHLDDPAWVSAFCQGTLDMSQPWTPEEAAASAAAAEAADAARDADGMDVSQLMADQGMHGKLMQDILQGHPNPPGFTQS